VPVSRPRTRTIAHASHGRATATAIAVRIAGSLTGS
jgi:hypothetical protein